MVARRHRRREPEFEGGSQPVHDHPPDEPGKARTPTFYLVAALGLLVLAMPVAWGLGALATVGTAVGGAGLTLLWVVWGLVLLAFLWSVWAMWRSAA